jgi:hypothetical protein
MRIEPEPSNTDDLVEILIITLIIQQSIGQFGLKIEVGKGSVAFTHT